MLNFNSVRFHSHFWKHYGTRKSCVNARVIPTAAYQVLHLLPEVGYPPPPWQWYPPVRSDRGVPEVGYPQARSDRGYSRWGTPLAGVPPSQVWWGVPQWFLPQPGLTGGTWGGVNYRPGGVPPWLGYPPLDLAGVPPPVDRQMDGWMERHVWKHYLPVVLRTRSVKKLLSTTCGNRRGGQISLLICANKFLFKG